MKYRRERDLQILERLDVGCEEMNLWTRELFLGPGTEKFRISEDMLELGFGVINKNYLEAKNDEIRQLIRRKVLHTREVVEAGYEIMEAEGSYDFDPYMVGAVTFLHDMGRFPQAHLGSFSDIKTEFDHAAASAEIVLSGVLNDSVEMGLDIKRIAAAIDGHSRLDYLGGDEYGKLIRDADKLGLMDYFRYHIEEYPMPTGKVSPEALKAVLEGSLVPNRVLVSRIDVFLSWLSWQHDFNFEATRELFETHGAKEYMLNEIEKMDKEVWEKVVEI